MDLSHSQLRAFLAVAEHLHFGRAAAALDLSQQALSESVQRLEAHLGVRLFDRTSRQVSITPAGEVLVQEARDLLAASDRLHQRTRRAAEPEDPPLRVAIGSGADGAALFAEAARLFHRPPVTRRALAHHVFAQQVDVLRDGGADLLLTYLPFGDDELRGLEQVVLREEPRAVFMHAEHRLAERSALTVDDIAEETFLSAQPRFSRTWSSFWVLRGERGGRGRELTLPVGSYEDVLSAITQGLLVVIAPAPAAQFYRGRGVVAVPLLDVAPARTALLWRSDTRSRDVARFVAAARRSVPADAAGEDG